MKITILMLMEYVDSKEDPLIQIIRMHEYNKFNGVTDS
jgi:hypothetical protein